MTPAARSRRSAGCEFTFADGGPDLRFADQRMFGGLWLSPGGADLPVEVAHIARDLFDPLLDLEALVADIRRRRSGIKRVLLNQTHRLGHRQHLRRRVAVAGPAALRRLRPTG